jgi:hypothetical protein
VARAHRVYHGCAGAAEAEAAAERGAGMPMCGAGRGEQSRKARWGCEGYACRVPMVTA